MEWQGIQFCAALASKRQTTASLHRRSSDSKTAVGSAAAMCASPSSESASTSMTSSSLSAPRFTSTSTSSSTSTSTSISSSSSATAAATSSSANIPAAASNARGVGLRGRFGPGLPCAPAPALPPSPASAARFRDAAWEAAPPATRARRPLSRASALADMERRSASASLGSRGAKRWAPARGKCDGERAVGEGSRLAEGGGEGSRLLLVASATAVGK